VNYKKNFVDINNFHVLATKFFVFFSISYFDFFPFSLLTKSASCLQAMLACLGTLSGPGDRVESVKTRISAPAHLSATGIGRVSM